MMTKDDKALWDKLCESILPIHEGKKKQMFIPKSNNTNIIDLHGFTIHEAYLQFKSFISESESKKVTVITGNGYISRELPIWADNIKDIREVEPINDYGAYKIYLYRK